MARKGLTMRNFGEAQAYSLSDHLLSRSVFALSRVVGVRNVTRPFWNRWRAALIDEDTLDRFLSSIGGLADWPTNGWAFLQNEVQRVERAAQAMTDEDRIKAWRRLSFLAHLVAWGCLPLSDVKTRAYMLCRDFYLQAEQRAFGARFARLRVGWHGATLWANLHLPASPLRGGKMPLVVLVHGMDDVKEEHLASELLFSEAGFAVLCVDGPGQGETFLLDGTLWPEDFEQAVIAAVDTLHAYPQVDTDHYAIVGVSWGGMWAYKIAAADPRVGALLDLGGPIDARGFSKLPFFLKSKFCQILGMSSADDIDEAMRGFSIRDEALLAKVAACVHIVHGGRDPIVPTADKRWLRDTLLHVAKTQQVELTVFDDGDHCCTQHAGEVRRLAAARFLDAYAARTAQADALRALGART
jgi:dienelactone hydrolase